jgi:phosphatidylinositol alpha-mannosyltransferase
MPMRIGMVTQSYYPHVGGVTEHVHHLSAALRDLGHEVTIITSGPATGHENGVIRIGRNAVFPINGALVNVTVGFGLAGRLRDIYERGAFDIIHIHCPLEPTLPLAALKAARDVDTPVIGTFHMCAKVSPAYEVFAGVLQRYVRRLNVRIAVSEAARAFAVRYFRGDYIVIPNGVCFEHFHRASGRHLRTDDRPTVLFVGRFDLRKNVPWLIRAYRRLLRLRPDCLLVLVGSGLTRPVCRMMAVGLGKAIRFEGMVPPADLPAYFAASDVFCSVPKGSESFGIVLLEAMAAGIPIVGTDIPGYKDVVEHGVEGLLVPQGDSHALVRALSGLIEDEGRRETMGLSGQHKARRFDWSGIARTVEKVYVDLSGVSAIKAEDELVRSEGVPSQ